MKTLTVRLPERIMAEIEAESRQRKMSKSDIVRERLDRRNPGKAHPNSSSLDLIADLIGSVEGLPPDLSKRKKYYLGATGYGQKHSR